MNIRIFKKNGPHRLIFLLFFLSSCTTYTYIAPKNLALQEPTLAQGKIPLRIGLLLQPEICRYEILKERRGIQLHYQIGESLCDGIIRMFNLMFKEVTVFESIGSNNMVQGLNAIIVPEVETSSILLPVMKTQPLEVLLRIKFSAWDINRKIIWADTYQGESRVEFQKFNLLHLPGFFEVAKKEKEDMISSLKLALEDLLKNTQEGMTATKWWLRIQ